MGPETINWTNMECILPFLFMIAAMVMMCALIRICMKTEK